MGPGYDTSFNLGYCYDTVCSDAFVVKLAPSGIALSYATFLGGTESDVGTAIAVDKTGAAFITGETRSANFPVRYSYDSSFNGGTCGAVGSYIIYCDDAYVTKLNPAGSGLLYSTFLGGSRDDGGNAIAVDGVGSIYITGNTLSSDFPITPGAFDMSYNGGDAFVVKLNPAGSALVYATFLGGSGKDRSYGIAADGTGSAHMTGYTYSSDFPATQGALDTSFNGSVDAFVAN